MGRFKNGLLFGGLLGAGLMWLSTTKKGREVKEQILDQAAEIYTNIKEQVLASPTYKDLNENEYVKMVKEYVDKYAIKNGMAENVKNMVVRVLSAQWRTLKEELKSK